MVQRAAIPLAMGVLALMACGSSAKVTYIVAGADAGPPPECKSEAECVFATETCDLSTFQCVPVGDASELGHGDGSPASVVLSEVYAAKDPTVQLVDLSFNGSDTTQLWATGYDNDSIHIGLNVTPTENGTWRQFIDPAAAHFMHKPPALVWGANELWGICGDNDNSQNDPRRQGNDFMGPALFTSDLAIFAKQTEGELGSHVDMLHNTSFCRGIAHVEENVFWTFNGQLGSLDWYDFHKPHVPGGDDHRDGEIYRYAKDQVKGVTGLSSHIVYDPLDKFLYVADTGNQRLVRLDTTKGSAGKELPVRNEILAKNAVMDGTQVQELVPPGTLQAPSGIEVHRGLVYANDAATGVFYAFDKTGKLLRKLDTGLGAKALSGFTFGPEGKIWLTDRQSSKIYRIDPI